MRDPKVIQDEIDKLTAYSRDNTHRVEDNVRALQFAIVLLWAMNDCSKPPMEDFK